MAIIVAASNSHTDINTAIGTAVNGDTVQLPSPGPTTWAGTVTMPSSKGITLDGANATISGLIVLNQHATLNNRITRFNLTANNTINTGGLSTTAAFRIDNCNFTGGGTVIKTFDNGPGLIDHCDFQCLGSAETIQNLGMGSSDPSGWDVVVTPGSDAAVYVEDCIFTKADLTGPPFFYTGCKAHAGYYGCRTVFRYNTLSMVMFDAHGGIGPSSQIGQRWWEVYENTFHVVDQGNQSQYVNMRAGSGVVFDNHKSGFTNLGGGFVQFIEETSGPYPELYQVGRGICSSPTCTAGSQLALDPAYVWGNDAGLNVEVDGSLVQFGRDVIQSTKPSYTPFTYPHPLQGAVTTYTLSITVSGSGTVTSVPSGISCPGDCSEVLNDGAVVTLNPAPGANARFVGWSGGSFSGTGPITVTMSTDVSATATFAAITDANAPLLGAHAAIG